MPMGWVMFFIGLVLPPAIGWWLILRRRADLPLSLLGLAALPMLVWATSLGAKIGPCHVGTCVSSTQHDRLAFAIAGIAVVAVSFGLLAVGQRLAGGIAVALGEVLGAVGVQKIDTAMLVALLILAAAAVAYIVFVTSSAREETRVPDFPPST
jgi:hypothetical protein